jgi:integrase
LQGERWSHRRLWRSGSPAACVSGARRSELAALRWDDLEGVSTDDRLKHRHNQSPSCPVLSPRAPRRSDEDGQPKSHHPRRSNDPRTERALHSNGAMIGPWMLAPGSRPANPDRISAWWRRARDVAGVDARWRLHDLRHWSATRAIAAGHDVRSVATRLGHSNPSMTLRVYAHAVESADAALADSLAGALVDREGLPHDGGS